LKSRGLKTYGENPGLADLSIRGQYLHLETAASQEIGEVLKRKDIDAVLCSQNRSTRIDDNSAAQSLKVCHDTQPLAPGVCEILARFYLDRYQISPANKQEINLGFGPA
jgi:hypothetical protein